MTDALAIEPAANAQHFAAIIPHDSNVRDTFGVDVIRLHADAANALQRCLREMNAEGTSYEQAARHLADAGNAIGLLAVLNISSVQ